MFSFIMLLELKEFLDGCKEQWINKQKEVEQRFLELEKKDQSAVKEPKQKKTKRTKKESQQFPISEDSFAKYAAELQIEFYVKVQSGKRH